jgi:hypothetical protein
MSNELSVLLQNNPALVQTGLDEDTLAVAGGAVNTGNKRISIRGKAFRKVVGGKEVSVAENNYMDVVIVKMAHTASRTFYAQSYKEGEKISPTCWSSDSRTPDIDVKTPQSKTCDTCQFSAKNSGANGTGTACRLSWRMAVVLPSDPAGDVMQLVLPATSCFGKEEGGKYPFRPYIQMLANNNVSAGRVVTKMQFDPKASTPKVVFSPVAAVNPNDMEIIQRQGKTAAAEAAVKLTVYQNDEGTTETPVAQVAAKPAVNTKVADAEVTDVVDIAEPVLRESNQAAPQPVNNASEVMKKWSVKS